jgi:hypothetical protein
MPDEIITTEMISQAPPSEHTDSGRNYYRMWLEITKAMLEGSDDLPSPDFFESLQYTVEMEIQEVNEKDSVDRLYDMMIAIRNLRDLLQKITTSVTEIERYISNYKAMDLR